MAKNKFYFSHDGGARNDDKIIAVRMKHKAEGYAVYFMILEKMLESSDYLLQRDYNVFSFDFRVGSEIVKSVIEDFNLFEFTEDGNYFFSTSFKSRMKPLEDIKETNRVKGIRGSLIKRKIITKEESLKLSDNQVVELNLNLANKSNLSTALAELKPSLSKKQHNRIEDNILNTSSNEEVKKNTQKKDLVCVSEKLNEEKISNSQTSKNLEEEKEKSSAKKEKELPDEFSSELRNSIFFKNVCEFFSQKSETLQMKVLGRMISIARENDFQEFIKQTTAYMDYKNQTGEKVHRFQNFSFEWNQDDWIDKFKKINSKSSKNGKTESSSPNKAGRVDVDKAGEFLERRRKERELQSSGRTQEEL
ncbi:DUF4373 domain-containing protein [Empedobacter falsenii]|uniref:Lin1244/Lin1753 domain-containing protein n=1 Tax=Empedobacter falsenii TaxID=343874 RepID=UPI00257619CF|nr:Lin1244/Lin1753 domain-containing protein [Empedobacter falsenii]MDM1547403.1 DUF4373 domain-containing protein [Empedobacter falsenii]